MKRKLQATTVLILSFMLLLCSMNVFVHAEERRTVIKVGFPIQDGLTEKDEEGHYSGYTYDYLKEIAQYTGWTYELVEVEGDLDDQLVTLMNLLQEGEIDLLGAMGNNAQTQELFDFPSENYGNAYSVIAVSNTEAQLDEYNISEYKNFHIALYTKAANRNEQFFQYAELNGLTYEIIWCDSEDEQVQAVNSGEADAMLTVNLSMPKEMRSIIKFSPIPFYFATTKGNTYVVSELNKAITYLSEVYPTLQSDLYNKYFNKHNGALFLNTKEASYVAQHPTLDVLVQDGFGPLQYYDKNHKIRGVANDVLKSIAEKTGWDLHYVYTESYDEYEQKIKNKEIDLVLSINYDYDISLRKDILLSNPYLDTEKVIVAHQGVDVGDLHGKRQAIYKGERTDDEQDDMAFYFDSVEESLQAVERGDCDYTYSNSYAASYYQYRNHHENIIIYPKMSDDSIRYSIGIIDKNDRDLSTIINKGIRSIEVNELEGYIYQNAQQNQIVDLKMFIKENPLLLILFVITIALSVMGMIYFYYRNKVKMNQKIKIENIRYRSLSDMLHEVTFTYDYQKDQMILSKEGKELFESDDVINEYSHYQSKIIFDGNTISFYKILSEKKEIDQEIKLILPHRSAQWYHVVIKMVSDGKTIQSAIGRIQNIHMDKLEKEQLLEESRLDGLTKLCNAITTKKEIAQKLQTDEVSYAFAILDLDEFKEVNDTYGHYVGDQVLTEIAKAMKEVFKEDGVLGRLGGDEFIIFVPIVNLKRLEEMIQMLLQELQYQRNNNTEYPIPTVSIGVSIRRAKDDFTSLYQRADEVLYQVKKEGKNNYRLEHTNFE